MPAIAGATLSATALMPENWFSAAASPGFRLYMSCQALEVKLPVGLNSAPPGLLLNRPPKNGS
ncbi:hypothetical protein WJ95_09355 [Burkholderia ubonensis]|nr:hypothetical protein WJ95_09355 [Burkholderia ubonensis]